MSVTFGILCRLFWASSLCFSYLPTSLSGVQMFAKFLLGSNSLITIGAFTLGRVTLIISLVSLLVTGFESGLFRVGGFDALRIVGCLSRRRSLKVVLLYVAVFRSPTL